jgi:hypothetical protein
MPAMLRLSPSDFAFLWEQCKRCFYYKVVHGIRQPSMPMAGIFKRLEGLQMGFYDGKRTTDVLPSLPPGVIRCGEKAVESEPVQADGVPPWFVYGKIDSLIEFDDGSWGILDFKTTVVSAEKGVLYGRQLHAYAHAFENPAVAPRIVRGEAPKIDRISKLGILCFEPSELTQEQPGRQVYTGRVEWIEIPRDAKAFLDFVAGAVKLLAGEAPPPTPDCDWCSYAAMAKEGKLPTSALKPAGPVVDAAGVPCPKCGSAMKPRNGRNGPFLGCSRYPDCRGTRNLPA